MKITREHAGEAPERICHTLELAASGPDEPAEDIVVAIDEDFLSWFYVAPGSPLSSMSQRLLAFARDLIGPGAWAVVQAQDDVDGSLFTDTGLCVLESYLDEAHHPLGVNVHVAQVASDPSCL
jgi:hypothetical protein